MEQSESALEGDFDACLSLATPARKACDVAAPAPPDTQLSAAKISLIEVRYASYGAAHRSCIVDLWDTVPVCLDHLENVPAGYSWYRNEAAYH